MEDTPPKRREAPVGAAMAFTSRSHPQSASSGQALRQRALSEGAAPHEVLLHVRNVESDSYTNPHQRLALDNQQSLDETKSQEELVEIDVQQPSSSETRVLLGQRAFSHQPIDDTDSQRTHKVKGAPANQVPHFSNLESDTRSTNQRQVANVGDADLYEIGLAPWVQMSGCAMPSIGEPQSASSGQPINQQKWDQGAALQAPAVELPHFLNFESYSSANGCAIESVIAGCPMADIDFTLEDQGTPSGAAPRQLPHVQSIKSDSPTNHRQEVNDRGAVPQDMGKDNSDADRLEKGQRSDESQQTTEINAGNTRVDVHRACCSGLLLLAACSGDWLTAKAFLEENPECIRCPITKEEDTVLHNAVAAKHTTFVTELVKMMTPDDLEITSKYEFTALHVAAQTGDVKLAKPMVEKNKKLLVMNDKRKMKPLHIAAFLGHRKMVSYLLSVTPFEGLTIEDSLNLLLATIETDLYDIALKILKNDPLLSATKENTGNLIGKALEEMARKPLAIGNESQLSCWKRRSNSWFKGICIKALTHSTSSHQLVNELWKKVGYPSSKLALNPMSLLFEAAKAGNAEFIIIVSRAHPDLIWQVDEENKSLFHTAIIYRQRGVFNLIYEIGDNKNSLATNNCKTSKENMLHLAGRLPPLDRLNIVSGAALQMQQEILWFKEIEKIVPRSYLNKKNYKDKTPKEIFLNEHRNLRTEGEKWMKDTANYCMLVATLIATVVFAAALTVPGGNNQETGTPIFLRNNWFMVFFISDAIALFSSSTSIVIFLSILTSRYKEEDFLKSLPARLVFGLATLLISMAGMMVAFSAICFLVYKNARAWTPVVVISSASIPVASFVWLHSRLWVDTLYSTYKSTFLFRTYKSTFLFRRYKHKLF